MFQLKFLLHLAVIVLDWQMRRYMSNPSVYVSKLLSGETIWLADYSVSRNNNAFPNTISTCRNGKLRNEVEWTEGLKTQTVAQLVNKFPHIRGLLTSTTEFSSHLDVLVEPKNTKPLQNVSNALNSTHFFFA
jgi:hypothetical protein